MNQQENSELNPRDTENTDINGDESNFVPSDDADVSVPNDAVVEPIPDVHEEIIISLDSSAANEPVIVEGNEYHFDPAADAEVAVSDDMATEQVVNVQADDILAVDAPNGVQEAVVEQKTLQLPQQVSGWQRIQRFFFGSFAEDVSRLTNLTQAIEDAPESSVNYVLRAELYMKMREYALAQSDFQRAYELAETHFELADWGLLEQVMRDRALTGLEKVQRRLR